MNIFYFFIENFILIIEFIMEFIKNLKNYKFILNSKFSILAI